MRLFLSLSFTFSVFGLYYIHFMLPSMEYQPHIWVTSSVAGFCIGIIASSVHRFFEDVSDIKIKLSDRDG